MTYRVILTRNGEYMKTLHRCKTRETAFLRYRMFKKENEGVVFPRKFVNSNGIKPVEYMIYVIKEYEETDTKRILRNKYGKLYEEKLIGDWIALDSATYQFEETFRLYGYNPVHDRKTIKDILKVLMVGAYKQKMTKQIIVVHNKLLIHNEEQFDMIVCKCKKDAQRLHHRLQKATKKNKIKSLIFMGTASPATVSRMYDIILDNTDWTIQKIRRTSTRP